MNQANDKSRNSCVTLIILLPEGIRFITSVGYAILLQPLSEPQISLHATGSEQPTVSEKHVITILTAFVLKSKDLLKCYNNFSLWMFNFKIFTTN